MVLHFGETLKMDKCQDMDHLHMKIDLIVETDTLVTGRMDFIKGMGNCISKIFVMFHITKGTSVKACLVEKGIYYRDGGYYEGGFHAIITKERVLKACYSMFGQCHGRGKRVWASGNTFEGEWKNDAMQEGRYFNAFHQSTFIGTFEHGKKHGMGRENWRSSNGKMFLDPCLR
jgi:hypothetical protein